MALEAEHKYLIIGPAWVGDMVMAQSLFRCLKQQQPGCEIQVLAPEWTRPLLARMPEVDAGIASQLDHGDLQLRQRRKMGIELREQGFTHAIVLPNSFKSALIPFHARIPCRIGWKGEWRYPLLNDCRTLKPDSFPRMVDRFAALAFPAASTPPADIPPPALNVDADVVAGTIKRFALNLDSPVLAVCPGAEFGEAKQWPAEHYASLVNALAGEGWQAWFFGSANDKLITESILADVEPAHLGRCHNLTGATLLGEAIDLLSCADAVVSNDSGLMHVAAALNRPVVALYGSTSPDFTPPLAEKVKLLATDIECRPCFKRQCPYGHLRCLTELSPKLAIDAVGRLHSA